MRNWTVAALAVLVVAGCGKKNGAVVADFQPKYNELRTRLQAVKVPTKPVDKATKPSPPPTWIEGKEDNNTAVLAEAQLKDPDVDPVPKLDLQLQDGLIRALRLTGPKNYAGSIMNERDDGSFAKGLEAPLNLQYLVVYRPVDVQLSKAINKNQYTEGHVTLQAHLLDFKTAAPLASTEMRADVPTNLRYDESTGLEPALKEWLKKDVAKKLLDDLGTKTGGQFNLSL